MQLAAQEHLVLRRSLPRNYLDFMGVMHEDSDSDSEFEDTGDKKVSTWWCMCVQGKIGKAPPAGNGMSRVGRQGFSKRGGGASAKGRAWLLRAPVHNR